MTTENPVAEAPLPTFDDMPLSAETREALAAMGYVHPTPVQRAVLEPASQGKDLVVQARTGTGKTTAFGLPIVDAVIRRGTPAIQVMVLCPTRELALQVCTELERLGSKRGVKAVAVYGGASMTKQIDQLAEGAQVLVGTPGRVLDHLTRRTLDPSQVRMLVLDEADEMLSMGFEREMFAIQERLPKERQTLLFSATLPPDIERMARDKLKSPELITLSSDSVGALSIDHFVYMVPGSKLDALVKIVEVENPESAIVFCNTKAETERVADALQRAGYDADWLNGDLSQAEREEVMGRARQGKLRFLVATDVAARGIDISHLTHVISHDFPDGAERYVHRTGRTGRAGRTGTAIALIEPKDVGNLYLLRLTYKIRPIERQLPSAGELKTRGETDLVEMLAAAFLSKPIHPDDLSLARRLFTHDRALDIVAGLLRDHLGARPEAADEAAAARRATRPPARKKTRAWENRDDEREPRRERGAERDREPRRDQAVEASPQPAREPRRERAPEPAPRHDAATSVDVPEERPEGAADDRPARRVRARRGPRAEGGSQPVAHGDAGPSLPRGEGVPQRALAEWTPPSEQNDDEPILAKAEHARPAEPAGDLVELFVNVGRREGVEPHDLSRVLTEKAGIPAEHAGRVRIRDRHAFVSVRKDDADRAIDAFAGETFGGRAARAEIARPRGEQPSPGR